MPNSIFILLVVFQVALFANPRVVKSSAPYLSGDTFRSIADLYLDEMGDTIDPEKVQAGSVLFVKSDYLGIFFSTKYPALNKPYILVSHNSDFSVPGPYYKYLDSPHLVAWFAQNVKTAHPKLHPIPIGIANSWWPHGDTQILEQVRKKVGRQDSKHQRKHLIYLNFLVETNASARKQVYDRFAQEPYCYVSQNKPWNEYLEDLTTCTFVLCPQGNGLDCLRCWEALYMGAYPIVMTSAMDSLFDDLPVVIVNNWDEVTEDFLQKKYSEFSSKEWSFQKLFFPYWAEKIGAFKQKALS